MRYMHMYRLGRSQTVFPLYSLTKHSLSHILLAYVYNKEKVQRPRVTQKTLKVGGTNMQQDDGSGSQNPNEGKSGNAARKENKDTQSDSPQRNQGRGMGRGGGKGRRDGTGGGKGRGGGGFGGSRK